MSYEDLTKKELLEIARERDLEGRTTYDKDELVAALEADDDKGDEEPDSDVETSEDGSDGLTAEDLLTPSGPLAEEYAEEEEERAEEVEAAAKEAEEAQAEAEANVDPADEESTDDTEDEPDWLADMKQHFKNIENQN